MENQSSSGVCCDAQDSQLPSLRDQANIHKYSQRCKSAHIFYPGEVEPTFSQSSHQRTFVPAEISDRSPVGLARHSVSLFPHLLKHSSPGASSPATSVRLPNEPRASGRCDDSSTSSKESSFVQRLSISTRNQSSMKSFSPHVLYNRDSKAASNRLQLGVLDLKELPMTKNRSDRSYIQQNDEFYECFLSRHKYMQTLHEVADPRMNDSSTQQQTSSCRRGWSYPSQPVSQQGFSSFRANPFTSPLSDPANGEQSFPGSESVPGNSRHSEYASNNSCLNSHIAPVDEKTRVHAHNVYSFMQRKCYQKRSGHFVDCRRAMSCASSPATPAQHGMRGRTPSSSAVGDDDDYAHRRIVLHVDPPYRCNHGSLLSPPHAKHHGFPSGPGRGKFSGSHERNIKTAIDVHHLPHLATSSFFAENIEEWAAGTLSDHHILTHQLRDQFYRDDSSWLSPSARYGCTLLRRISAGRIPTENSTSSRYNKEPPCKDNHPKPASLRADFGGHYTSPGVGRAGGIKAPYAKVNNVSNGYDLPTSKSICEGSMYFGETREDEGVLDTVSRDVSEKNDSIGEDDILCDIHNEPVTGMEIFGDDKIPEHNLCSDFLNGAYIGNHSRCPSSGGGVHSAFENAEKPTKQNKREDSSMSLDYFSIDYHYFRHHYKHHLCHGNLMFQGPSPQRGTKQSNLDSDHGVNDPANAAMEPGNDSAPVGENDGGAMGAVNDVNGTLPSKEGEGTSTKINENFGKHKRIFQYLNAKVGPLSEADTAVHVAELLNLLLKKHCQEIDQTKTYVTDLMTNRNIENFFDAKHVTVSSPSFATKCFSHFPPAVFSLLRGPLDYLIYFQKDRVDVSEKGPSAPAQAYRSGCACCCCRGICAGPPDVAQKENLMDDVISLTDNLKPCESQTSCISFSPASGAGENDQGGAPAKEEKIGAKSLETCEDKISCAKKLPQGAHAECRDVESQVKPHSDAMKCFKNSKKRWRPLYPSAPHIYVSVPVHSYLCEPTLAGTIQLQFNSLVQWFEILSAYSTGKVALPCVPTPHCFYSDLSLPTSGKAGIQSTHESGRVCKQNLSTEAELVKKRERQERISVSSKSGTVDGIDSARRDSSDLKDSTTDLASSGEIDRKARPTKSLAGIYGQTRKPELAGLVTWYDAVKRTLPVEDACFRDIIKWAKEDQSNDISRTCDLGRMASKSSNASADSKMYKYNGKSYICDDQILRAKYLSDEFCMSTSNRFPNSSPNMKDTTMYCDRKDNPSNHRAASTAYHVTTDTSVSPVATPVEMWSGGFCIPRDDKKEKGGEDGWFTSGSLGAIGTADGVSEWSEIANINPRAFAEELLQGTINYLSTFYAHLPSNKNSLSDSEISARKSERNTTEKRDKQGSLDPKCSQKSHHVVGNRRARSRSEIDGKNETFKDLGLMPPSVLAKAALTDAHKNGHKFGSSTAIVALLNNYGLLDPNNCHCGQKQAQEGVSPRHPASTQESDRSNGGKGEDQFKMGDFRKVKDDGHMHLKDFTNKNMAHTQKPPHNSLCYMHKNFLGVANLGDSSLMQLRRRTLDLKPLKIIVSLALNNSDIFWSQEGSNASDSEGAESSTASPGGTSGSAEGESAAIKKKRSRSSYGVKDIVDNQVITKKKLSCDTNKWTRESARNIMRYLNSKGIMDLFTRIEALYERQVSAYWGPMGLIHRVREMQHSFNLPYQFARIPTPDQWVYWEGIFPRLVKISKQQYGYSLTPREDDHDETARNNTPEGEACGGNANSQKHPGFESHRGPIEEPLHREYDAGNGQNASQKKNQKSAHTSELVREGGKSEENDISSKTREIGGCLSEDGKICDGKLEASEDKGNAPEKGNILPVERRSLEKKSKKVNKKIELLEWKKKDGLRNIYMNRFEHNENAAPPILMRRSYSQGGEFILIDAPVSEETSPGKDGSPSHQGCTAVAEVALSPTKHDVSAGGRKNVGNEGVKLPPSGSPSSGAEGPLTIADSCSDSKDEKEGNLDEARLKTEKLNIAEVNIAEGTSDNNCTERGKTDEREKMKKGRTSNTVESSIGDTPDKIETYDLEVQVGDLIIMGSDGLFDNLFDYEIAALCGNTISPTEAKSILGDPCLCTPPRDIAKALAVSAYWRSVDSTAKTPFERESKKWRGGGRVCPTGLFDDSVYASTQAALRGGKQDDITVIASWITEAL